MLRGNRHAVPQLSVFDRYYLAVILWRLLGVGGGVVSSRGRAAAACRLKP